MSTKVTIVFPSEVFAQDFSDFLFSHVKDYFHDYLDNQTNEDTDFKDFVTVDEAEHVYRATTHSEALKSPEEAKNAPKIDIPETLPLAVGRVQTMLEEVGEIELFRNMGEDEARAVLHRTLGQWIRNNWGLWSGDSKLWFALSELGLVHPDDMSGLIITCAHREEHKKFWCVDQQVAAAREYWANLEKEDNTQNETGSTPTT